MTRNNDLEHVLFDEDKILAAKVFQKKHQELMQDRDKLLEMIHNIYDPQLRELSSKYIQGVQDARYKR